MIDPTLDVLDGTRVAQVTVHLGDTLLHTETLRPPAVSGRGWRVLRAGWGLLLLAPLLLLWDLPGVMALVMLAGAMAGTVAMVGRPHNRTEFTIGAGQADLRFDAPWLPERFTLVAPGPVLRRLPQMEGTVTEDGVARDLRDVPSIYPLPADVRVDLKLGLLRMTIVSVAPPRPLRGGRSTSLQWSPVGCSLGLHLAVVVAAMLVPTRARPRRPDAVPLLVRTARISVPAVRGEPLFPSFVRSARPMGNTLDGRIPTGLYRLRGPVRNPDPNLARRLAEDRAAEAGVLGLLRPGSFRDGFPPDNTVGNLFEGEDFTGWADSLGLMGHRAQPPGVSVGSPTIRGALDGSVVRRIIRRHLNEVQSCFQNELQSNPSLGGETTVQFVVLGSGRVERASRLGSSLHNQAVGRCLVQAARRWLYPQSHGMTVVEVPFRFR